MEKLVPILLFIAGGAFGLQGEEPPKVIRAVTNKKGDWLSLVALSVPPGQSLKGGEGREGVVRHDSKENAGEPVEVVEKLCRESLAPSTVHSPDTKLTSSGSTSGENKASAYRFKITGLGKGPLTGSIAAEDSEAILKCVEETLFPVQFRPPQPDPRNPGVLSPATPSAFENVGCGWSIKLKPRSYGRLVAIDGEANYSEAEFIPSGYGEVASPEPNKRGDLPTRNLIKQPRIFSTVTRFQLFALPGTPYEINLFKGTKTQRCTISVN